MEIISFIRSGAITHQDSAGTGIVPSAYNRTKEPLTFYQLWFESNKSDVTPRWESKKLPPSKRPNLRY